MCVRRYRIVDDEYSKGDFTRRPEDSIPNIYRVPSFHLDDNEFPEIDDDKEFFECTQMKKLVNYISLNNYVTQYCSARFLHFV